MRPDEEAAEAQIEREKRHSERFNKAGKFALNVGTTALGIGASAKIAPFLSEHLPLDLAVKGISKVNPALGALLKKGRDKGLNLQDGLDFIKEKFIKPSESKEQESKQKSPEQGNVIRQYSDKLDEFLKQQIASGQSPLAAGAIAQNKGEFSKVIKNIEKDHKTNWSKIIESVFGNAEQPQQAQGQMPQQNQQPMQQGQQQQQPGPGQQALMQALQQLTQLRGGGAR